MAAQTIFSWLNTFADGDNPMAGSQIADSAGINGNWWKIGEKMNFLFELPATALKTAIIGGAQIKPTAVDGMTIEQDSSTKKLKVKTGGIGITQCGTDLTDGAGLEQDGSTKKIRLKDKGIPAGKVADDNVKTKSYIHGWVVPSSGYEWYKIAGGSGSATSGIPILRACSITKIRLRSALGEVASYSYNAGEKTISADSYLSFCEAGQTTLEVYVNGSKLFGQSHGNLTSQETFITIELENS